MVVYVKEYLTKARSRAGERRYLSFKDNFSQGRKEAGAVGKWVGG